MRELWIFGYGSLMWRPGFPFAEQQQASVHGLQRSFCIYSVFHRGTAERPGLVLGLDRGGACRGMAYRIAAADAAATIAYLREREQVTGAYRETRATVTLEHDAARRTIDAVCYVAERAHPQYAGNRPMHEQAMIIRHSRGRSGGNAAYLVSTVGHLRSLGIRDRPLERLQAALGGLARQRSVDRENEARRRLLPVGLARAHPAAPLDRLAQSRFAFRRKLANAGAFKASG